MSGRRQHYLPRFLQRAFRFRGEGDGALVYAHERDKVYSPNVMGLGQERDFYGNPRESELDKAITATEGPLSTIHRQLLEGMGRKVDPTGAATLVSAISIRTKSVREAMTELAPLMVGAMGKHFQDERVLREAFRKDGGDPKLFEEQWAKNVAKLGHIDRNKRAGYKALARQKWNRFRVEEEDEIVQQMKRHAAEFVADLRRRAAEAADAGYLKALTRDPATKQRADRFATFSYALARANAGEFYVLGDCGTVGIFSDGSFRLVIGDIDDETTLDAVLLPLSPDWCLVGERIPVGLDSSPEHVNRLSASLSHRFFVSNRRDGDVLEELRMLIGTVDPIATEEELLRLMRFSGVSEADD